MPKKPKKILTVRWQQTLSLCKRPCCNREKTCGKQSSRIHAAFHSFFLSTAQAPPSCNKASRRLPFQGNCFRIKFAREHSSSSRFRTIRRAPLWVANFIGMDLARFPNFLPACFRAEKVVKKSKVGESCKKTFFVFYAKFWIRNFVFSNTFPESVRECGIADKCRKPKARGWGLLFAEKFFVLGSFKTRFKLKIVL